MSSRVIHANAILWIGPLAIGLATLSLGSCASVRQEAKSHAAVVVAQERFGASLEAALAAQVANPEAAELPAQPQVTDGARAVLAVENYRKGTTKPLVREATSLSKSGNGGGQ
jgi:type IV pilus biogenesis protein CpaD/CtpE